MTRKKGRLAIAGTVAAWLLHGCGSPQLTSGPSGLAAGTLAAPAALDAPDAEEGATPEAPLANPGLEVAMEGASAHDTPEYRQQFFRELLQSRLIVPVPSLTATPLPPGHVVANGSGSRRFVAMESAGGRAMPVFTSPAAFRAWQPSGSEPVVAKSSEVFAAALEGKCDAIVINPAGPTRTVMSRPVVSALADGLLPERWEGDELRVTVASPGSRSIGPAKDPDPALIDALRARSASLPDVLATYLVEAQTSGGEPSLLVAMEIAPDADPQPVVQAIGAAIRPKIPAGRYVDILVLIPGEKATQAVRSQGPAVFER